MPIYEYRCQSCANELEVLVRNGKEPESCPACEGKLARKISRAGVIFKGSGFYVTDSRGSSSGGEKKSSGAASEGKSTDSKSETSSTSADSKSSASDSTSSSTPSPKTESSSKPAD